MLHISWKNLVPGGERFHVGRTRIDRNSQASLHSQDYEEVFWIEQGEGLHIVNGQKKTISAGDLVWVRRSDRHGLRVQASGESFVLVNVAFSFATAAHLQRRYFEGEEVFLCEPSVLPARYQVDRNELRRLGEWTAYLDRAPRTQLEIDRFLLDVMHRLHEPPRSPHDDQLPDWLGEALNHIRESRQFAGGVRELASLCRKTPEHVNATLKATLGLTATEVLNQIRMDYAASQLRISTQKILEICFDCGFENLGHFYKVFKARFGITPRAYRIKHLMSVGG